MSVYAEIEETDSFFTGRADASHWYDLSRDTKQNALEQAARILDESFDWNGVPKTDHQKLRWPRKNVVDLDGSPIDPETVPEKIKIASMEQALYLTGAVTRWMGTGIKSASIGGMSISLESSGMHELLSPAAVRAVRGFGKLRAGDTARCGSLIRG